MTPQVARWCKRSTHMLSRSALSLLIACGCSALSASLAFAAPTIASISPRGAQIGQPTTLVITGSDLSADTRLVCEAKIAVQKAMPGSKANRVDIEVTFDPATPPGLYAFRVANDSGISSPIML